MRFTNIKCEKVNIDFSNLIHRKIRKTAFLMLLFTYYNMIFYPFNDLLKF